LPIFNWWKLNKGEIKFLFREPRDPSKKEEKHLIKLYKKIASNYIDRYGISKGFKHILNKQREIAMYKLKYIRTEDRSLLTHMEIAEAQLSDMTESGETTDFNETKAMISKQMGFSIDPKTTTVPEYQGYILLIQKQWLKK